MRTTNLLWVGLVCAIAVGGVAFVLYSMNQPEPEPPAGPDTKIDSIMATGEYLSDTDVYRINATAYLVDPSYDGDYTIEFNPEYVQGLTIAHSFSYPLGDNKVGFTMDVIPPTDAVNTFSHYYKDRISIYYYGKDIYGTDFLNVYLNGELLPKISKDSPLGPVSSDL